MRWDDERSPGHDKPTCLSVVLKWIQIITESVIVRFRVFLRNYSKQNLNFQNWSKALCLGVSEPTRRLAVHSTADALRNRQRKQAYVKENEKKICVKEI